MKKLILITVLCLFTLQCEQGWIKDILVPPVIIEGCTNSSSCNYNSDAEEDDGSCLTAGEDVDPTLSYPLQLGNDCAGECGGAAVKDDCGVCNGIDGYVAGSCYDCAGVANGTAIQDCNGECGGTAAVDCAGVCDGTAVLSGCDNVCYSTAVEDCTGLCGGSYSDCSVYDIDGNGYTTVTIGTQEWLVQNLKVTKYRDGSAIPTGISSNLTTGAYAVYADDPANADIYGNLYNWYAVDDDRGICPEGWHVPSYDEWETLRNFGGYENAGGRMKEEGHEHWDSPNIAATNESGFTGLPAGRIFNGSYGNMGKYASFWSSSESNIDEAWKGGLSCYYSYLGLSKTLKQPYGFSVRCLKD